MPTHAFSLSNDKNSNSDITYIVHNISMKAFFQIITDNPEAFCNRSFKFSINFQSFLFPKLPQVIKYKMPLKREKQGLKLAFSSYATQQLNCFIPELL